MARSDVSRDIVLLLVLATYLVLRQSSSLFRSAGHARTILAACMAAGLVTTGLWLPLHSGNAGAQEPTATERPEPQTGATPETATPLPDEAETVSRGTFPLPRRCRLCPLLRAAVIDPIHVV